MKNKGFTLVEILIALTILTIGLVGVASLFPVGLLASKRSGDLNVATLAAQEALETIKLVASSSEDNWKDLADHSGYYSVNSNFWWDVEVNDISSNLKKVNLIVHYLDRGKTNSEVFVTYIANYFYEE